MEPALNKFDRSLASIYQSYLQLLAAPGNDTSRYHPVLADGRKEIYISVYHSGAAEKAGALGFVADRVETPEIMHGQMPLTGLAELSQLPEIKHLLYGEARKASLETSSVEIRARGTAIGADSVWSLSAAGVYAGLTGNGIIVGIIDTGIDFRHETFNLPGADTSRILSIWDQGLTATATEATPEGNDAGRMAGINYGVEYTRAQINTQLADLSTATVRHRDLAGHGTHVAGIAAGNGKQVRNLIADRYQVAGIAPEADIVVVKHLELDAVPTVNNLIRFRDAVNYILRIAEKESRPVVINCSFNSQIGAHDGLHDQDPEGDEKFIDDTFSAASGRAIVFSAGNYSRNRQHVKVTMPASGSIVVPFELVDGRIAGTGSTPDMFIDCWYPGNAAGVTFAVKTPGAVPYSTAAALDAAVVTGTFDVNKTYNLIHITSNATRAGVTHLRNNAWLSVVAGGNAHEVGVYTLQISAPAGTVIHCWCDQNDMPLYFQVNSTADAIAGLEVTDRSNFGAPSGSPGAITVAAYDDTNDHMACFSSQGPLVDYMGTGAITDKPDISAPGNNVKSAKTYAGPNESLILLLLDFVMNYVEMSGTSMAAPHVTGLVALMLQKKPTLTLPEIKTALRSHARTRPKEFPAALTCPPMATPASTTVATVDEAGAGKIDVKATLDSITP